MIDCALKHFRPSSEFLYSDEHAYLFCDMELRVRGIVCAHAQRNSGSVCVGDSIMCVVNTHIRTVRWLHTVCV